MNSNIIEATQNQAENNLNNQGTKGKIVAKAIKNNSKNNSKNKKTKNPKSNKNESIENLFNKVKELSKEPEKNYEEIINIEKDINLKASGENKENIQNKAWNIIDYLNKKYGNGLPSVKTKNLKESINIFMNKILNEEDEKLNDLINQQEEIIFNKSSTGIKNIDILDFLKKIFDFSTKIKKLNNSEIINNIFSIFKHVDESSGGSGDKNITSKEIDDHFKIAFDTYKNRTSIDIDDVSAFACVGTLKSIYKDILNENGSIKAVITTSDKKIIDEILKKENKELTKIFNEFYTESTENNKTEYHLNVDNEIVKATKNILDIFKNYTFSQDLIDKFTTFEKTKAYFKKIIEESEDDGSEDEAPEGGKKEKSSDLASGIVDGSNTSPELKNASPEAAEIEDKANNTLGGSSTKNLFGLGVVIPGDEQIVKQRTAEGFISDLTDAFTKRIDELVGKYSESSKNVQDKIKERNEKEKNKYKNDLSDDPVKECLKLFKQNIVNESSDKNEKLHNTADKIGNTLNSYVESQKQEFEWKCEDFRKKASSICLKYAKSDNYKKSLTYVSELYEAYVNLAYAAAKILKALKKHVDIQSEYINSKDIDGEEKDSKKKEFEEKQKNFEIEKDVQKIFDFLRRPYKNDTTEIAKYLLINILSKFSGNDTENHTSEKVSGTEQVMKILNGSCSDAINLGYIVGGTSGHINGIDRKQVKPINGKFTGYDLSGIRAIPYKDVMSLFSAGGLDTNCLNNENIKALSKRLKDLKNLQQKSKIYVQSFNSLKKLLNNSARASTVTEAFDFFKKRKVTNDNELNLNQGNGKGDTNYEFIQNNSSKITLKPIEGTDGFQFDGDGAEDVALRQLFKGLVVIQDMQDKNSWYIMNSDKFQQALKLADYTPPPKEKPKQEIYGGVIDSGGNNNSSDSTTAQDVSTNNQSKVVNKNNDDINDDNQQLYAQGSVETSANVDSTYPTSPQQKIKKICYGMNNGRYTIKSKEYFN